ncbi:MAG: hypothetical protein V1740_01575 [Candidatus Woesearchaeota archaeon]
MKKLIVLFIIFILIGAYLIVLRNDIDLAEKEGKKTFIFKFSNWVWDIGKNTFNVVGYAIKQPWLPENPEKKNETIYIISEKENMESTIAKDRYCY